MTPWSAGPVMPSENHEVISFVNGDKIELYTIPELSAISEVLSK
jgi:hypothetical protein